MAIILYDLCGADPAIRFSPYCWRVKMALAHKGLTFETRPVPFTKIKDIANGFSATVPVVDEDGELLRDSWDIGMHLDKKHPEAPLFGGTVGVGLSEFVVQWAAMELSRFLNPLIAVDIWRRLAPADQAYYRQTREKRYGKTLEAAAANREALLPQLRGRLDPLRKTFEWRPFLGGKHPVFADYAVFSVFQWVRVMSPLELLAPDDPAKAWFERCLDLYDGLGRAMPAARA